MYEIIAGMMTAIDVLVVYSVLQRPTHRNVLAIWTGILHTIFPLIGFIIGEGIVVNYLHKAGDLASILLFLLGCYMLLQQSENNTRHIHPIILASIVSLDTFSVSVSFGMLELQKSLFIITAGISAALFATIALRIQYVFSTKLQRLSGLILMAMAVINF